MQTTSKYTYGIWRTDKEKEAGFSHELISPDSYEKSFISKTNLDELWVTPFEGVDTILKALKRNVERIPNNDWLGTRVGDAYEWMTWKDAWDTAEALSHGFVALELNLPEL
jgi:long-chain acyl-CoA synthetase